MSTFTGDSKLNFYPTEITEVYRIAACLGRLNLNTSVFKEKYNGVYLEMCSSDLSSYSADLPYIYFERLLSAGRLDIIHDCFNVVLSYGDSCPILDPFAGEGEFLSIVSRLSKEISIAVELDENRYNKIEADYKFNCAFEDIDMPASSVSVLLYNPPYGATNGIRNVKHYLTKILQRDILSDGATAVMVIRTDDFLDSFDLIYEHFDVFMKYRVDDAEFAKYKQVVIYAKYSPKNTKSYYYANDFTKEKREAEVFAANPQRFQNSFYSKRDYQLIPGIKFGKIMSDFKIAKKREGIYSSRDKVWDWIIESNEANLGDDFKLVTPKPPKTSEVAVILSSGVINGEIKDNVASHIVAGGVKKVSRIETVISETEDGPVEKLKETRLSRPYLAVLVKQGGELKIKTIEGNAE